MHTWAASYVRGDVAFCGYYAVSAKTPSCRLLVLFSAKSKAQAVLENVC